MKVFVDNCLSPTLASTLDGYLRHTGSEAVHIADAPCGRHASDLEWIAWLRVGGSDWLVLTGDTRIRRNRAERAAFRQAGLRAIVLAPGYQKVPVNQQASFVLWRWPDVEAIVRLTAAPFMFELPLNKASRIRQMPL